MSSIKNPIRRGQTITIPAGTPFTTTHPQRDGVQVTGRRQQITVHSVNDGYVQRWDDRDMPRGTVHLPEVIWPGTGGYWKHVQVTPELLAANDLPALELPVLDKHARFDLGLSDEDEGIPSLEDGYTNRRKAPAAV